jgi:alpha/beta superfamily hydrolase
MNINMSDVILHGPSGRLEGRYYPASNPESPIALVCHPHPLYGGTMNNKVAYTLYKSLAESGMSVLRFNFRGVGNSEGVFDNGQGESNDAAAALEWLESMHPNNQGCFITGFSFGSWVALQLLMRRPETDGFIAISPPAHKYSYDFLAPCPAPGLIIQGTNDEVVPKESVDQLVVKLKTQVSVDYKIVDGADHFFTHQLDIVDQHIKSFIKDQYNDDN